MTLEVLLCIIIVLLLMLYIEVGSINKRLKERFPTAEEEDIQWAKTDPMGHWEAHKDDKKRGVSG